MKLRVFIFAVLAMMSCLAQAKVLKFDFELSVDVEEAYMDFMPGTQTYNGSLILHDKEGDGDIDYSESTKNLEDELLSFSIDFGSGPSKWKIWRVFFTLEDDSITDFWLEADCYSCGYRSFLGMVAGDTPALGSFASFTDHPDWLQVSWSERAEWTFSSGVAVSEPASALVFVSALFGLMIARRRKV